LSEAAWLLRERLAASARAQQHRQRHPGVGRRRAVALRAKFRDSRPRLVGEPRSRSQREDATLSLGRAALELAEPYAHVPSENVRAGVGLDDDHLMPVRMPGRRQQADSR
jgi:hypothetical protein